MPRDPIDTVIGLRRRAMEECHAKLATHIAAAAQASEQARAAARIINDEMARACSVEGDDSLVEAFAAWLPSARQRLAQAEAAHEQAEAEVGRSRAELAACRTALEAIETLRDRRLAERAAAQSSAEQRMLDEAGSRSHHPRGPGPG